MDKEIKIRDASFFARIIAEKEGISFEAAQLFIREFFLLIEKGLKEDNYVHIKGLGSFKKICLEVDNGEEQSVNELIFVPDKDLQSVINKPFEHFEPVVVSSDVLMEQLLKEQQTEQKKEEKEEASKEILDEVKTENEGEESLVVEESQLIENNQKEVSDNSENSEEGRKVEEFFLGIYGVGEEEIIREEPMKEAEITEKEEPIIKKEEVEQKPVKDKSKTDLIWMFSFVIFILFIFVLLLFFRLLSVQKELDAYINLRTEAKALERIEDSSIVLYPDSQPTEEVENGVTEEESVVENVEEEKIVQQETQPTSSNSYDIPARESLRYSIVGTQSTHHVVHGETLRILSEVYFGSKGYWPYIYYHNEEIIKDPNNITKDMVLRIPKLNIKGNQ